MVSGPSRYVRLGYGERVPHGTVVYLFQGFGDSRRSVEWFEAQSGWEAPLTAGGFWYGIAKVDRRDKRAAVSVTQDELLASHVFLELACQDMERAGQYPGKYPNQEDQRAAQLANVAKWLKKLYVQSKGRGA